MYAGDNDVAEGHSAQQVAENFKAGSVQKLSHFWCGGRAVKPAIFVG
jgi:hypothetical protein